MKIIIPAYVLGIVRRISQKKVQCNKDLNSVKISLEEAGKLYGDLEAAGIATSIILFKKVIKKALNNTHLKRIDCGKHGTLVRYKVHRRAINQRKAFDLLADEYGMEFAIDCCRITISSIMERATKDRMSKKVVEYLEKKRAILPEDMALKIDKN